MTAGFSLGLSLAGVQKAGTTALFSQLRQHPRLVGPRETKETHFFDDESLDWDRPDYGRLGDFYPTLRPGQIAMDGTPLYLFWPPSLARLRAHNPAMRLILMFRDPIDRAWSQWRMSRGQGWETLSFGEAIRQGRDRIRDGELSQSLRAHSYVERGFYARQVRRALEHFPRRQVLFLLSDDFRRDHMSVLQSIARFLDIAAFAPRPPAERHATPDDGLTMAAEDEAYLRSLFSDDVHDFATLTGLDVSGWRTVQPHS